MQGAIYWCFRVLSTAPQMYRNGVQGYESGRLYTFNLTEPPGLTPIYYAGKQRAFVKTATCIGSGYTWLDQLRIPMHLPT